MTKELQQVLDAAQRVGIAHNNKAGGQWLLVSTDDQLVALRAALTATTNEAAAQAEKRLDAEARVGNGVFGVGVPERLVIEAAQRAAKHPQGGISEEAGRELRQMIADNAGRAAFLESHPAVSEELARLIEENERLSAALAAQPVQAQGDAVAWCSLTPSGKIAYFDGKPMVMPGPVGNEHHPVALVVRQTAPAVDRGLSEAAMFSKALRAMSNGPTRGMSMSDSAILQNAADFLDALAASAPSQAEPHADIFPTKAPGWPFPNGDKPAVAGAIDKSRPPGSRPGCDSCTCPPGICGADVAVTPAGSCQASETCKTCGGAGIDGDVGDDGRVRDVDCACRIYREKYPSGARCLHGCHTGERCHGEKDLAAPPAGRTLTADEVREIADRLGAVDPTDSFWQEFASAILAASSTTAGERDHG